MQSVSSSHSTKQVKQPALARETLILVFSAIVSVTGLFVAYMSTQIFLHSIFMELASFGLSISAMLLGMVTILGKRTIITFLVLASAFPLLIIPWLPLNLQVVTVVAWFGLTLRMLGKSKIAFGGMGVPFLLFLLAITISLLASSLLRSLTGNALPVLDSTNIHLSHLRYLWQIAAWVLGFGIFVYVLQRVRTRADLGLVSTIIIATGLFAATYGYYQLLSGYVHLHFLRPSLTSFSNTPNSVAYIGSDYASRLYGSFSEPKELGRFLLIPLFLTFTLWTTYNVPKYLLATLYIFPVFLMTFSTTAFVGLGVGMLFWIGLLPKTPMSRRSKQIVVFCLVVILAWILLIFVPGVQQFAVPTLFNVEKARVFGFFGNTQLVSSDYSSGWSLGWDLWKSFPIFGVGIGNSTFYSEQSQRVFTSFNLYLLILAENGIIGFVPFALLITAPIVKGVKSLKKTQQLASLHFERSIEVAAISGIVASLVVSLAFGGNGLLPQEWILLGVIVATSRWLNIQQTQPVAYHENHLPGKSNKGS